MRVQVDQWQNPLPNAKPALRIVIDSNRLIKLFCCLSRHVQNAADPSVCTGTQAFIAGNKGTIEDGDFVSEKIAEIVHRLDSTVCRLDHVEDILVRQLRNLRWAKVNACGVMRIVIEHQRQIDRLANAAIMLDDCSLGWLLKIRKNDDNGVCAAFLGILRKLDADLRAIVARAIDDRHASPHYIFSQAEDSLAFFRFHCDKLAAGSRNDQPIDVLLLNQPLPVKRCGFLIELILLIEHRERRGKDPTKALKREGHAKLLFSTFYVERIVAFWKVAVASRRATPRNCKNLRSPSGNFVCLPDALIDSGFPKSFIRVICFAGKSICSVASPDVCQ